MNTKYNENHWMLMANSKLPEDTYSFVTVKVVNYPFSTSNDQDDSCFEKSGAFMYQKYRTTLHTTRRCTLRFFMI